MDEEALKEVDLVEHIGIDHIKSLLTSISDILCDAVGLVKNGVSFSAISRIAHIVSSVKTIIMAAPGAIPELHDLDAQESAELGALAYDAIKKMLEEIAK